MTKITATWPDGALTWTDGKLTGEPEGTLYERLLLDYRGAVQPCGDVSAVAEDWPTDPYAFIGACKALYAPAGEPKIVSDGPLPDLVSGGQEIHVEGEVMAGSSYPDAITNPLDPPTVNGTNLQEPL
jgi:hypothetical protein